MRVALLCSGLGNIYRGHEIFARDLFNLLKNDIDITLFKGGGANGECEVVIDNISRNSGLLRDVHVAVSPKWAEAVKEQERLRVEAETFAFGALQRLMEGGYDVIHCLEQEVCNVIYANRHLFSKTPKVVFSNGGAIPAKRLPACDFVQEHTDYNLERSRKDKAFMIPHGVDTTKFHPDVNSDFRQRHGIPADAFVVLSVGTICYWHKRMDYVIKEVAQVPDAYLVIVGQECPDTDEIVTLGKSLMKDRIVFTKMNHDDLPQAYAAADVFVLGSLFETFGIVYIEAMAMGLPVICTDHPNQKQLVKEGVFLNLKKAGELTETLKPDKRKGYWALRARGPEIVAAHYSLGALKTRYIDEYVRIAKAELKLDSYKGGVVIKNKFMAIINSLFGR